MKKTIIAGAVAAAIIAPVYAELEGDLSVTYHSQYSYRGASDIFDEGTAIFTSGQIDNTYEAAINLSWRLTDQWSIVAGGNVNTVSDSGLDHDRYRVGVLYKSDCYSIELGYQNQDLRLGGINLDTSEIYLDASTKCPLTGGTVRLFVAHDMDAYEGTYAELSLNKVWDLCDKTKLDVTVGVSYSFDYWDFPLGTGDDWNHAYITLALPYQATENLTLAPYVSFTQGFDALDPTTGPFAAAEEDAEIIYGLKASVKF